MESGGRRVAPLLFVAVLAFLRGCSQGQADGDCPADGRTWVAFGQRCYYFVHDGGSVVKSYTIQQAKDICNDFALLTIRSAIENQFIVDYSLNVWKSSTNVWLGMYYNGEDEEFRWLDESNLTYKNWEEGGSEDLDIPRMDTCVTLHVTSGMWENVSCSENPEKGVVCETPLKAVESVKKGGSPVLSAMVILSVILILGISAFVWFLQQRSNSGSPMLPSFEYHPPFRAPSADQTCLVEAEEIEETS